MTGFRLRQALVLPVLTEVCKTLPGLTDVGPVASCEPFFRVMAVTLVGVLRQHMHMLCLAVLLVQHLPSASRWLHEDRPARESRCIT